MFLNFPGEQGYFLSLLNHFEKWLQGSEIRWCLISFHLFVDSFGLLSKYTWRPFLSYALSLKIVPLQFLTGGNFYTSKTHKDTLLAALGPSDSTLCSFRQMLERFLARYISWLAILYNIIARQQLGALPNRPAVSLTTYPTYNWV